MDADYLEVVTAQAPVNIAVIKYWGKKCEVFKIPINDSLSGTLNCNELCTTTSIYISDDYETDELFLNGERQGNNEREIAMKMLDILRGSTRNDPRLRKCKVHIVSENNFPTAAGLASSASGYACLAFALGHTYGVTDLKTLSIIARFGSGSACRSIYGGFVQWHRGHNNETSFAKQVVDHTHWPEMRVVVLVVNDRRKDVPSSSGMSDSVKTSALINYRADKIVPERISAIKDAIREKNFHEFADITMKDSNQFHAICLDTSPPLFYLNDTSRHIIKLCTNINSYYNTNKVAYTFDAGPNACVYLLDDFVDEFLEVIKRIYFNGGPLRIQGCRKSPVGCNEIGSLMTWLDHKHVETRNEAINYIITTSIGDGPRLVENHLQEL